jgi:hypothetical protein
VWACTRPERHGGWHVALDGEGFAIEAWPTSAAWEGPLTAEQTIVALDATPDIAIENVERFRESYIAFGAFTYDAHNGCDDRSTDEQQPEWYCTRSSGHPGWHVAHNGEGCVLDAWSATPTRRLDSLDVS